MKQQIILLYAGQYQIPDERTGVITEGTTINYYFNTELSVEDNANGTKGTRPAKSSCDYALMSKIFMAPALYEAEFSMNIGSDGKPVLKIVDLDFVDSVKIVPNKLMEQLEDKAKSDEAAFLAEQTAEQAADQTAVAHEPTGKKAGK